MWESGAFRDSGPVYTLSMCVLELTPRGLRGWHGSPARRDDRYHKSGRSWPEGTELSLPLASVAMAIQIREDTECGNGSAECLHFVPRMEGTRDRQIR